MGISALAGCAELMDEDDTESDGEEESADDESDNDGSQINDPVSITENVAALINDHDGFLRSTSYSMLVEIAGDSLDGDGVKILKFESDGNDPPTTKVVEKGLDEDFVEEATHIFSGNTHHVDLHFVDGIHNETDLDLPDSPLQLTGTSVFDAFLVGTELELTEQTTEQVTFSIESHRHYNEASGTLVVDADSVIRTFKMEGEDDTGNHHSIQLDTTKIGNTVI